MADTPKCPWCGADFNRTPSNSDTLIWRCHSWKSPSKGIEERSRDCRIRELENENAELRRLLGEVCKAGRSAYAVVKAYGSTGPVCRELYAAVVTAEEYLKKTGE